MTDETCPYCGAAANLNSGRYCACGSWRRQDGTYCRSEVCLLREEVDQLRAELVERTSERDAAREDVRDYHRWLNVRWGAVEEFKAWVRERPWLEETQ